jgi:hypothetical protein
MFVCVMFLVNRVSVLVVSPEEGCILPSKLTVLCGVFLWQWKKFLSIAADVTRVQPLSKVWTDPVIGKLVQSVDDNADHGE